MFYTKQQYIQDGLVLAVKETEAITPIAEILWDKDRNDAYIKTIDSRFQDYIVSYEDFIDFIRLIDEAYDLIRAAYHKPIEN